MSAASATFMRRKCSFFGFGGGIIFFDVATRKNLFVLKVLKTMRFYDSFQ